MTTATETPEQRAERIRTTPGPARRELPDACTGCTRSELYCHATLHSAYVPCCSDCSHGVAMPALWEGDQA